MSKRVTFDEANLIDRIVRRDQQALSELYQLTGHLVFGLALRVMQNRTLAEEVTQDTFLKIWNQAERWDPQRGTVVTWMLTITRYTAIDRLRKEQRLSPWIGIDLEDLSNILGRPGPQDDPAWHDGRLIQDLVEQLPDDQKEVVELAFFGAMSHTEMAEHLQLPLGTVKGRVRRGLQKLRELWLEATS